MSQIPYTNYYPVNLNEALYNFKTCYMKYRQAEQFLNAQLSDKMKSQCPFSEYLLFENTSNELRKQIADYRYEAVRMGRKVMYWANITIDPFISDNEVLTEVITYIIQNEAI